VKSLLLLGNHFL